MAEDHPHGESEEERVDDGVIPISGSGWSLNRADDTGCCEPQVADHEQGANVSGLAAASQAATGNVMAA